MDSELRLSSPRLASSMPMGEQSSLSQLGQFDPESQSFGSFRPPTEAESQPLHNTTHAPHAFIRPPQQGELANSNFLVGASSTPQHQQHHQAHPRNVVASHSQSQGQSTNRAGLHQPHDFHNRAAHGAHMRETLHGAAVEQIAPPTQLSQTELAMGNNAHQAQNDGLAQLESPSQPYQPDFVDLDSESVGPAASNGSGELQGFKMIPNPPHLDYWRERLFNVDEMITLSEEEYARPIAWIHFILLRYTKADLQTLPDSKPIFLMLIMFTRIAQPSDTSVNPSFLITGTVD